MEGCRRIGALADDVETVILPQVAAGGYGKDGSSRSWSDARWRRCTGWRRARATTQVHRAAVTVECRERAVECYRAQGYCGL